MTKTAVFGVGNCASSLVQGIGYCREFGAQAEGVLFADLEGHKPGDIEVVAAFDVDRRKVGKPLPEAIFSEPNNTLMFFRQSPCGDTLVSPGAVLDGVSMAMQTQPPDRSFMLMDEPDATQLDVVSRLRDSGAEVAIEFLPVGSQGVFEFYAECAIEAGLAFVNAIPVLIASDSKWSARFTQAGLSVLGDDFKVQIGATIVHRALVDLFNMRGAELDRSYQLNAGGNKDFLNMIDANRLHTKRVSKTEWVQSVTKSRLPDSQLRVGPSDYVPWLEDRKVAFVRLEGRLFGGAPANLEVRLDVEDLPNAAVMAMAAIRCTRIALNRNLTGAVTNACGFLFKHPPEQMQDHDARNRILEFAGSRN